MRVLFTGDTHLDVSYPPVIARQRNKDFQNAFKQIIDGAIQNNVSLVCHAGDLFNNSSPAPVEVQFVMGQLARLGEKGIPFYCIRGNHEGAADLDNLFKGWAGEYVKGPAMNHVELIDP
nr:metallophosphoesterase [Candidatus Sigynarchaeota archaeon]